MADAHPGDLDVLLEAANGGHHEDCRVDDQRCDCAVHVAEAGLRLLGASRDDAGYWVSPTT